MNRSIRKYIGRLGRERMVIKRFKDNTLMYEFLNRQSDNKWKEDTHGRPSGTYANLGGVWTNVRKIDKDLLPHI